MPDLGLLVRQSHLVFVVAVVDGADDDRPIRVALLVGDQNLVADAGDEKGAALHARPDLRDPNPPRIFPLPIPVEKNEDTPELVDVNLLAGVPFLSDHQRRLVANDVWLTSEEQ